MRARATIASVSAEQSERIRLPDQRDFVRAVNLLNKAINRVRIYEPEANYYMQEDELHLMIGPSHDDGDHMGHPERGALHCMIDHADCGAW